MEKYVIIKNLATKPGEKPLKVLLLDGHSSVLEVEGFEKVQGMCDILNTNSDSGHFYEPQKIGS